MKVKRITALLVALVCLFGCFGCSGETTPAENQTTTEPVETGTPATTEPVETSTPVTTEPAVSEAAMEKLDGKKVLIVGNSLCFYGHAVLRDGTDVLTQEQRNHDRGYFYQLCKSQGAEVSVTDWAYGDHSLFETLGNSCTRSTCLGVDHLSYLTDRYYDYVVFTPYEKDHDVNMQEYLQPMMDIFLAVNPNVQFILAVPHMAYTHNFAWAARLPEIDSGKLVYSGSSHGHHGRQGSGPQCQTAVYQEQLCRERQRTGWLPSECAVRLYNRFNALLCHHR